MDTLYTSYVILKLKSLLFHYFPKILGHSLAVFLCIAYIRKDLSQCFFIIFCDKLLILRQKIPYRHTDGRYPQEYNHDKFLHGQWPPKAVGLPVQESLPASLR